ncbi:(Fe-S)-binding protein [Clostridium polyendosporum]|uniref:(Fe-S)-binding protein n=1 Tax=Clostridium polyendosporum TaxID=69208 RepID=A0A919S2I8_9CLOT|nr:tRNA epoxyqueuosine(34) reductase QueG [Clostridium polyendosporum]GIM29408.1 (Fe-S)-binding protein [Clostridium polyendosporum]
MDLRENIMSFCNKLGLDLVGFTECRVFHELRSFYENRKATGLENEFEEEEIEKRINPKHYMDEGKTIISIAFPYLHGVDYVDNGFSVYTRGQDYHVLVKKYLNKICDYIESLGGKAISFVDSNTLPERYIAYLCGLGFIGKNNMLITEKYGSYVFLGEIITDMQIPSSTKRQFHDILEFKECKSCEICFNECPTKSINKAKINSNICLSYITQKKEIDDNWIKLLDGRVFGCDSCQKGCPFNNKVQLSVLNEFYPLEFMNDSDYDKIITINNGGFKESLKKTSCGWRGKNVLQRNALIRKALYENKDISKEVISSPYVKGYQERLLKFKKL